MITINHEGHRLCERLTMAYYRFEQHFPEVPLGNPISQNTEIKNGPHKRLEISSSQSMFSQRPIVLQKSTRALIEITGAINGSNDFPVTGDEFFPVHSGNKIYGPVRVVTR